MRMMISAIAALTLAACGGQSGGNESGSTKSATGGGESATLQPGQWEMTTTIVSMNVPNMPQGMNPPMPPPTTVSVCLTPEQARAPGGGFITGSDQNTGCRSENFTMANGRIQGVVQCDAQGTTMRANISGQFSADNYEITQQVETAASGMTMNMEARTAGRRTGDCTT